MAISRWEKLKQNLILRAVGVYKHMTLGVRAAVIVKGRVLLVRHSYVGGWHFPGGGVDPGETSVAAALRETEEETGFRPTDSGRLLGLYHSTVYTDRDHVALFLHERVDQVRKFVPNGEIVEIGWFDPEALPDDVSPATLRRMAEIAGHNAISPQW